MQLSIATSAIVAALVGIAGALAIVLSAAQAVGASPAETASWVTALCLSMALTSGYLSWRYRVPVITAWSTPGAAVIAATAGTIRLDAAAGAFLLAGGLIVATALIAPLDRSIRRIPMSVAAGMLAGVLVRFVLQMMGSALADEKQRFAAVTTFVVTASGIAMLGVGSALWGLLAGLAVLGLDRIAGGLHRP